MLPAEEQLRILLDGVEEVLPLAELEERVALAARGERPPLRAKLGVDPTTPDIHLGHTVVLRKLRDFQRLGHTAVLIIGGFTAQVGDPSGRSSARPRLTAEEVAANAATYLDQARTVLSPEPLEVHDNATWLAPLTMAEVLTLTSQMTLARMLERSDFAARYGARQPIAISEFLYPLLQGQDSVAVRSDVELGGTDQTFNLLVGRLLQERAGQTGQVTMTLPLLEGTDGSAKMSKTAGNTIALDADAADMFGKAMSIPDPLMVKYLRLVTDVHPDEVDAVTAGLADGSRRPVEVKRFLGRSLVALYHGEDAAREAEAQFDRVFKEHALPEDVAEHPLGDAAGHFLPTLLQASGLVSSTSEARRAVQHGAVRLDGTVLTEPTATFPRAELVGRVLQLGRRHHVRLV